jgi:hypothetical protein
MPRNVHFSQGTTAEKRLYEDVVIEALKIYGHDVYYIPRSIVNTDFIFNEDELSKFGEAFQIEMYLENVDGFEGDGDLLTKFGVEIRDSVNLVVSNRRWEQLVSRFQNPTEIRPQEGDLIYFPLVNGLFEINYVEDETPFYQLQNIPTFKLTCQQFEYSNEELDTGIDEIDIFETRYAIRTRVNLGSGSGEFVIGEDVTQTNGTLTITGEVATVGDTYIDVVNQRASDSSNTGFVPTTGSWGNITGASGDYAIATIDSFDTIDDNDPYADNPDFEVEGNSFIDFSTTNPFGMPNITS